MKKLETKYRNDELSPAELQELRNRIKSMSDYEIGEEMYQTWMNEKIDVTSVPDKQIDKIKAQIENSIKEEMAVLNFISSKSKETFLIKIFSSLIISFDDS